MDKLATLILDKYVNLAKDFLSARYSSYDNGDIEKVAGYLIETDRTASLEKRSIFSQAYKAKRALRSATKAHEVAKLNKRTQKLLAKSQRLEQDKPGSIGKLISGALAASAVGAIGGGLLMRQYDSRTEQKRQRAVASRFFWEGLQRGRSPQLV